MPNEQFQITKAQYDGMQRSISTLEQHKHTGNDSLQTDPSQQLNAQYYGLYAKVTVTSTQIKALHTSPVTLIPAKGANSIIIVDGIAAKLIYNTAAYTGSNPIAFTYTNASGTAVTAAMGSTFLNGSSTSYDFVRGIITEFSPTANAPIVASVASANPAAGNSTLIFVINYRVVTF